MFLEGEKDIYKQAKKFEDKSVKVPIRPRRAIEYQDNLEVYISEKVESMENLLPVGDNGIDIKTPNSSNFVCLLHLLFRDPILMTKNIMNN